MPKVKVPRKSTSIDMTAMCDVSFLLLTFFMLTSKFRPAEAVPIDLPNSRSQIKLENIMTISVDKDGAAYFSVTNPSYRGQILERMLKLEKYKTIQLSNIQKRAFADLDMFGFSITQMPQVLSLNPNQYKQFKQPGIPKDSLNCEIVEWVHEARYVDPDMRIAIKGDKDASIKDVKKIMYGLTELIQENRFNLITTLSGSSKAKDEPTEN